MEINQMISIGALLVGLGVLFIGLGAFFKGFAQFAKIDHDNNKGFFKRK